MCCPGSGIWVVRAWISSRGSRIARTLRKIASPAAERVSRPSKRRSRWNSPRRTRGIVKTTWRCGRRRRAGARPRSWDSGSARSRPRAGRRRGRRPPARRGAGLRNRGRQGGTRTRVLRIVLEFHRRNEGGPRRNRPPRGATHPQPRSGGLRAHPNMQTAPRMARRTAPGSFPHTSTTTASSPYGSPTPSRRCAPVVLVSRPAFDSLCPTPVRPLHIGQASTPSSCPTCVPS